MKYVIDYKGKYDKQIFDMLLSHNMKHTGDKKYFGKSFYIVKNGKLVAAMNAFLSWDWVSINEVMYDSKESLGMLVSSVYNEFEEVSNGLNFESNYAEIATDLIDIGFEFKQTYKYSPKLTDYYYTSLTSPLEQEYDTSLVNVCEDKNEAYEKELVAYTSTLKEKYKVQECQKEVSVSAFDGEKFVGGVVGLIFDDYVFIDLLVVDVEYRNKSIATELMKLMEDDLDECIAVITLNTTSFQAKGFYEKIGYTVVEAKHKFMDDFDSYSMIKKLKRFIN